MDTKAQEQKPDVIKFLLGEGQFEGMDYGDRPGGKPPYWWRTELRKQFESIQSENHRLTSERDLAYGEIKELVKALDEIQFPLKYMQIRADKDGNTLNGTMAFQLSQDASYLKSIAKKASDQSSVKIPCAHEEKCRHPECNCGHMIQPSKNTSL